MSKLVDVSCKKQVYHVGIGRKTNRHPISFPAQLDDDVILLSVNLVREQVLAGGCSA